MIRHTNKRFRKKINDILLPYENSSLVFSRYTLNICVLWQKRKIMLGKKENKGDLKLYSENLDIKILLVHQSVDLLTC